MNKKTTYDYSLIRIDYPNHLPKSKDVIRVICSKHGKFNVKLDHHKNRNQKCPKCRNIKPSGFWHFKKNCKLDALKYNTRIEWQIKSVGAYNGARFNGWLDECCKHMIYGRKIWLLKDCKKDALNFKTRSEWCKKSGGAYSAALRKGWLDECCSHMKVLKKQNGYWNFIRCKKDALNYKTKTEWHKAPKSGYGVALTKGWLEQCCNHMVSGRK